MNKYIDLTAIMNHRMVYPKNTLIDETTETGIDNIFFYEEDLGFDKPLFNNSVSFIFKKNSSGFDNVVCDGQILFLNEVKYSNIFISGFCTYGHYIEIFTIEYSDGTAEKLDVLFSDTCWPLNEFEGFNYDQVNNNKASQIFHKRLYRIDEQVCPHIYYNAFKLNPQKTIKKIVFPNNCFMNIFGITLED